MIMLIIRRAMVNGDGTPGAFVDIENTGESEVGLVHWKFWTMDSDAFGKRWWQGGETDVLARGATLRLSNGGAGTELSLTDGCDVKILQGLDLNLVGGVTLVLWGREDPQWPPFVASVPGDVRKGTVLHWDLNDTMVDPGQQRSHP